MQLIFFSQRSIIIIKQQLMRKGGEASLEGEWRIKKNRDMQMELDKQTGRERGMSEAPRQRRKQST